MEKPTKQRYSFEVKKEVIDRLLAGETRMDLAKEFELTSPQQVKDWGSKWREVGDEALKSKPKPSSSSSQSIDSIIFWKPQVWPG